ncbi:MAG: FAD-dependent oxidoreductase [Pseudomonadota bacterium]
MSGSRADIVLVGGGHAHVAVLADWAQRGVPARRATLLTPHPFLRYSGMLPGWIAGEHSRDAGTVDLRALARAAGVELVLDRCVAIDPQTRSLLTLENGVVPFEHASIDVGGVGRSAKALGDDSRLIDIRPIHRFVAELEQGDRASSRIAVIGGGAGGVELAFALRNREGHRSPPPLVLIAGEQGLLPGFSSAVRRKVRVELGRQGIRLLEVDGWLERGVLMAGEEEIAADQIVAALGSMAPDWPRAGGLAVDEGGFIAVDPFQRSTSHPHIFAAGDCARRVDRTVPHSGLHAVHTGPVLAANLRAALLGGKPRRSYWPRPASLYLLSTGQGEAIASYGSLTAQGRWVSRLKAWIDKRWIASYAKLSEGA